MNLPVRFRLGASFLPLGEPSVSRFISTPHGDIVVVSKDPVYAVRLVESQIQ